MTWISFNKAYRDQILTNISIAYMNNANDFVASKIAPFVKVEKDSGEIFSYGKQAMRVVNDERAIGGAFNKVRYEVEKTQHYYLKDYGLIGEVLEEDVENAEAPLNAETDTTELVTGQVMTAMEKRFMANINTTNITNYVTLSGTSQWSDYTGTSDPFKDITLAQKTIAEKTGKSANSIVLSFDTLLALKNHPSLIARFKGIDVVTNKMVEDTLGALFGIQYVYISSAREFAGNMGANAGTLSLLWGKKALVYYSESNPTLKSVSFAKTYAKRDGIEVVKVGQDKLAQEALERKVYSMIRVSNKYDQVFVNTDCAYLINNAIA